MSISAKPAADSQSSTQLNIAARFLAVARQRPARQAIWCEGRSATYRQLAEQVCRWSALLHANGVARGDKIAVLLPNSIEFVVLMLAAADIGAVLVPLSPSLPPPAVSRACKAAQVRHLVAGAAVMRSLGEKTTDFAEVDGLWLSVDEEVDGASTLSSLALPLECKPAGTGEAGDEFILTMTSGSTGEPKPIVLTQRTKINRVAAAVELYSVSQEDVVLAATPLYHSLAERLALLPLLTGGSFILMSGFSVAAWLETIGAHGVTFTIAVSSQLKQMAEELQRGERKYDLKSLRCLVSSSALLERQVKEQLLENFSCDFHECYGASEIAIATNLDSAMAKGKLDSVGIAAPGVEIKILGTEGQVLPVGATGEIACKTPMLFGGYFNRPDLTRNAMWGEYFKTGDLGRLDEDGFLYFMGRCKDLIISGGINVFPSDIEAVVNRHPSVKESAAFAVADERLGEVVALAIVPQDKDGFNLRELRFYCAKHLADFQQPRKFFILDALPRNAMGKLQKFELVKQFASNNTSHPG